MSRSASVRSMRSDRRSSLNPTPSVPLEPLPRSPAFGAQVSMQSFPGSPSQAGMIMPLPTSSPQDFRPSISTLQSYPGSPTLKASSRLSTLQPLSADTRSRTRSKLTLPDHEPHRASKQKSQWLKEAKDSTAHFKKHGSPIPVVWILVENNSIPPNAIAFEEDAQGPLFIARALLEGGLHLGKAARHYAGGALIHFGGREITVSSYEVLVCTSQLRWGLPQQESFNILPAGSVVLSQNGSLGYADIPRIIIDNISVEVPVQVNYKRLAEIKTVVLVDDSLSMGGGLWEQAREALAGVAALASQHGSKGLDVFFLHRAGYSPCMKSRRDIESLFDSVAPEGPDTPTAAKLDEIIHFYLPSIERKDPRQEPITIVVITDGAATDQADFPKSIVDAARRLERANIEENMFNIVFVQIGNDEEATIALIELDDNLADVYHIRDIVDTVPFDPDRGTFDTHFMIKILIGNE